MLLRRILFSTQRACSAFSTIRAPVLQSALYAKQNAVLLSSLNQRRFFSNQAENEESNTRNSQQASLETKNSNPTDSTHRNQHIPLEGSHIYRSVVTRVAHTCSIYLGSQQEQKDNVPTDSRFYYVKQEFDQLSPQERENFRSYIDRNQEHRKPVNESNRQAEEIVLNNGNKETSPEPKKQKVPSKSMSLISKTEISELLNDSENGPIFERLIFKFLEPENRDRFLYLQGEEDELEIGNIRKMTKKHKPVVTYQLTEDLPVTVLKFKSLKPIDEASVKKPSEISGLVTKRVMATCRIYLDAPSQKREAIHTDSRFYYAQQILDSLDFQQTKNFRAFLDQTKDGKAFKFLKKYVVQLLEDPSNGPILKRLGLKFLEANNPDRLLYISKTEDEVDIGKVVPRKKGKRERLIYALTDNLAVTRERYENPQKSFTIIFKKR